MQTAKLRNMLYLHRAKKVRLFIILFGLVLAFTSSTVSAQREIYREEQDLKPYYFGLTLSAVSSHFQLEHNPSFLQQDSILVVEAPNSPGISLRLVAALNVTNRFELRFNPGLIFTNRPIVYKLRYADRDLGTNVTKSIESIITTFPLDIKFKSDRIGNFRVYMLGGGKIDIDLAANAKARQADDIVKISKYGYGIEGGIGFNFYRKSVTISPEVKFSSSLNNLHDRTPALNYSRVVDRIMSRMIIFSKHLEG